MNAIPVIRESINTQSRSQIVDLTSLVQKAVARTGVKDGFIIVFSPHTTAGITINENYDPDVKHDLLRKLTALVPKHESYYQHDEGNSDSHLKTATMGNSSTIIIEGGKLLLGRWQGIYFCEFDGPRTREVWIKIFAS